jgi:hypothetical protein
MEHVRGSMLDQSDGNFFFHESTIMNAVYLVMLENSMFPQIAAEVYALILQPNGVPAHFGDTMRTSLDKRYLGRWVGRLIGLHES